MFSMGVGVGNDVGVGVSVSVSIDGWGVGGGGEQIRMIVRYTCNKLLSNNASYIIIILYILHKIYYQQACKKASGLINYPGQSATEPYPGLKSRCCQQFPYFKFRID